MSSAVWAIPAARVRDTYILRFLKDAKCSVRVAEVRLFKTCFTMPSRCLFSEDGPDMLANDPAAGDFVADAFAHSKCRLHRSRTTISNQGAWCRQTRWRFYCNRQCERRGAVRQRMSEAALLGPYGRLVARSRYIADEFCRNRVIGEVSNWRGRPTR